MIIINKVNNNGCLNSEIEKSQYCTNKIIYNGMYDVINNTLFKKFDNILYLFSFLLYHKNIFLYMFYGGKMNIEYIEDLIDRENINLIDTYLENAQGCYVNYEKINLMKNIINMY